MIRVALTYDDGPGDDTEALLDVLWKHDAHATFFVLGRNIEGREATLRRAVAEGHELGIHGWDHQHVDTLTGNDFRDQLIDTASAIYGASLTTPRWWRPPWNESNGSAAEIAAALGYGWAGVTLDGLDVSRDTDAIVYTLEQGLAEGAIIGLHDGVADNGEQVIPHRRNTVAAVGRILERCMSVTVSELLAVRA